MLSVRGEVGPENEARCSQELFKLLQTDEEELVLDLTGLKYMSSAYVGSACLFALYANQRKRTAVVVAGPRVGRILTMAGLDKLTEVRIEGEVPEGE